jgi:CRP/FNR family transcriptional activator FtrB
MDAAPLPAQTREQRDLQVIEGMLERLRLCEGVDRLTLRGLAVHARLRRAHRGETVVQRGARVPGLFAVVHGAVKLRLLAADGEEAVLALLGAGATFGSSATMLERTSKSDAVAVEESLLLLIGAEAFALQMTRDARLARNVAGALAEKSEALVSELALKMLPAVQRLSAYLDSLAEPAAGDGCKARLPLSKTFVAARLGMKKETLSRLLGQLARAGVVSVDHLEVTILDRARLLELSSGRARAA